MDFKEIKLYDDKTFEDLIKDIYEEHGNKKKQINNLVEMVTTWVKDADTAMMLVPIITGYVTASIKNDKYLIDLGTLIQKMIQQPSKSSDGTSDGYETGELSPKEKDELEKKLKQIKIDMSQNIVEGKQPIN